MTQVAVGGGYQPHYCFRHWQVRRYVLDNTDEWFCDLCIADELRAAEAVLRLDRIFHTTHKAKAKGCPFCYPGMIA